jgi:hypothetical protein
MAFRLISAKILYAQTMGYLPPSPPAKAGILIRMFMPLYLQVKCHACGEYPHLKSNTAIPEELARLSAYLTPPPEPGCPNSDCEHSGIGVSKGSDYYASFGKTKSGSKRYRCKACRKTFSVGVSTLRQKQPH